MHYYPKNIGDYRRDTMNLSLLEHGVYTTLIDHYTLNEKPFPLDQLDICWLIGARTEDEKTAVCLLLSKFFVETDNGYIHKRCDREIAKYHSKSDKAKESIGKRWNKDTNVIRTYNEGNTNQEPITNNQEPITNKDLTNLVSDLKSTYPNADMSVNKLTDWFSRKYFTNTETKKKVDINLAYLTLVVKKTKEYVSWYESDKSDFKPQHKLLTTFLNQESWDRDYGGSKLDRLVIANKLAKQDSNFYNLTKEEQNERINSCTE